MENKENKHDVSEPVVDSPGQSQPVTVHFLREMPQAIGKMLSNEDNGSQKVPNCDGSSAQMTAQRELEGLRHDIDCRMNVFSETLSQKSADIQNALEEFRKMLEEDRKKEERFNQAYDELQMYKRGLKTALLKPYIYSLIDLFDTHQMFLDGYKTNFAARDNIEESEKFLLDCYERLSMVIIRNLEHLKIKRIKAERGDTFDPEIHECQDEEETNDPRLADCISKEYKSGWIDVDAGHCLRSAVVSVFKFVAEEKEN